MVFKIRFVNRNPKSLMIIRNKVQVEGKMELSCPLEVHVKRSLSKMISRTEKTFFSARNVSSKMMKKERIGEKLA